MKYFTKYELEEMMKKDGWTVVNLTDNKAEFKKDGEYRTFVAESPNNGMFREIKRKPFVF